LPIHGGLFMAYASSASSSPVRPGFFYACFGELAEAAVWAEAANSFLANSGEASLLRHSGLAGGIASCRVADVSPHAFLATQSVSG
jgi:hypothetical protein